MFSITKEEAKLVSEVLLQGMPDAQKKRDKLAKLNYKIEKYLLKVK